MDTVYVVVDHNHNEATSDVLGVFFDPQAATDAAVKHINEIRDEAGEPLVGIDNGLTVYVRSPELFEIEDPWMEYTTLSVTETTVS